MAGDERRTPDQIKSDHQKIAALLLRGWKQKDIAAELGLSESTVSRDVKALRAEWAEEAKVDMSEQMGAELSRLDAIEKEAWAAWEESKKPSRREQQSVTEGQSQKVSVTKNYKTGDPRYMATIQWCWEQRARLFGLIKNKVSVGGDPDEPIRHVHSVEDLTDDELKAIITRAQSKDK